MNSKLELKLVKNYPEIFKDYHGDKRKTCMAWGMECGDGWYNIINNLCQTITLLTYNNNIKVTASQIKEKFGGLRFYYNIEEDYNFINKIDYVIRNFMIDHKLGKQYWKIIKFKQKIYKTTQEKIEDAVDYAENKSLSICEECGQPGKTTGKYWLVTLCKKCEKEK